MYNEKKYRCNDIFMVRTPALPFQIYLDLENKYEGNLDKLINDYNLYDFFKENLFIASKNLYGSFEKYTVRKESGKQKKIKNYKESILKYLIRSTIRPTPFAGFSKVGLGEFKNFNSNDELKINSNNIKNIGIDNLWFHNIIKIFENNENILYQLNIKINPICYKSGDRFKNPFYTNIAFPEKEEKVDFIKNNSIKYSPLIEFIEKERCNFISFSNLIQNISKKYPDVDLHIIKNTIVTLIKKEFILTELRSNLISKEALDVIIKKLSEIDLEDKEKDIFEKLKKINLFIKKYNNYYDFNYIKSAVLLMEEIHKSDVYLSLNTGIKFINNKIDYRIKNDLEEFIEIWKYMFVDKNIFSENESICLEFQEYYGINVEIPFTEFIDPNGFDGIKKIKSGEIGVNVNKSQKEELIKKIIEKKIAKCILKGEDEIEIYSNDIESINILKNDDYYPTTFDMNFFITKNKNEYNYYIGPNVGCDEGGGSFQRFENVFDKEKFINYCSIYENKTEYIYGEIKEINNNGRIVNILNKTENYERSLNFGFTFDNSKLEEIKLEDLYIGIDSYNLFYITYKNQKIKFTLDNMLNSAMLNDVAYVLCKISKNYQDNPFYRISMFNKINKYFIPRIKIGKVVVYPKTWILYADDFSMENFEKFKNEIKKYIEEFNVEKIIYLKNNDNRIIINLDKSIYISILFKELKKNRIIELSELEKGLFGESMVIDEYNNKYVSEFIFTFTKKNKTNTTDINSISKKIIENNRKFNLFDDGWIYIKLYNIYDREEDLFYSICKELLPNLDKNRFFFIRYTDNIGNHFRLRFKFINNKVAIKNMLIINLWINYLQEKKIVGNILYDTYRREINRYGGLNLIDKVEEVFEIDSKFVIEIINKFELKDPEILENVFFEGILSLLKVFVNDINKLKDLLSLFNQDIDIDLKEKFHKNNKKYVNLIKNIFYNEINYLKKENSVYKLYLERNRKLEELTKLMDINKINDISSICLSLSHMFCNRLYGNRDYEDEIMTIIYLAIKKITDEYKYNE